MIQINLHPDHRPQKSWRQMWQHLWQYLWQHLQGRWRLTVICLTLLLGATLIPYARHESSQNIDVQNVNAQNANTQNANTQNVQATHSPTANPQSISLTPISNDSIRASTANSTKQSISSQLLATVTDLQLRWPKLLHVIASALPPNTWLIELAQIDPVATPTTPPDSALASPTLRLTGQTTDLHALALFMQRLQQYGTPSPANHPSINYVVLNRSDLISITEEITQFELDLQVVTPQTQPPNIIPVTNNATLLRSLSVLARAHHVELSTLEPPPTLVSNATPATATCNVGVITSYHNLARFFVAIATPPHAFTVSGVDIVPYTPQNAQQPDTTRYADTTTYIHARFQIHQLALDPSVKRPQISRRHLTIPHSVSPFRSLRNTPQLRPTISDLRLTTIAYDHASQRSVAVLIDHLNTPHRLHIGQRIGRLTVSAILPKTVELTYHELGIPRRDSLTISPSTTQAPR